MKIFKNFKNFSSGNIDYIVVGLGNPGSKYENTRHNAGFYALDAISAKYNCKLNKVKFKSNIGTCTIAGKKVLLIKPSTFMNLSGQAVLEATNFYKIPPENTIIIFDDISLDVGKLRIRKNGSDGGQKGMQSIISLCGSNNFPRIRLGIGAKPHPDYELSDWVLSKFSKEDKKQMETAVENATAALELIINEQTDKAMNLYN